MYKWLSGLLSGTSSTLHCSGANSHHFIMFCHNWHSSQTSALWLALLSEGLCFHQRPSSLASSLADQSLQTWPDRNSRGLKNRGISTKSSFLQSGIFCGLMPRQRAAWQAALLHARVSSQEMPRLGSTQGCVCVHQHTIHTAPAAPASTTPDFQLLETALNGWQGRGFYWNVFN